jgi:PDZ domain-containing protein
MCAPVANIPERIAVTLFATEQHPFQRGARVRRRARIGWTLVTLAIVATVVFALVPSPYVIEKPGPVFDTLGTVRFENKTVPLISITGQKTYPTSGSLDMLTVNIAGSRDDLPNWLTVATAWLTPSEAVLPVDAVYPRGETVQQSNDAAAIDMQNSQRDAIAAALTTLHYDVPTTVTVGGFSPDSPSDGILKKGDVVVSVNGESAKSVRGLRALIAKTGAGVPVSIAILRDGEPRTMSVTPVMSDDPQPAPIIGILPAISYDFPFDVKIQLENVGGPSAGQMFALGIIDKLTPGQLNGGHKIAGTGAIDASGTISVIGGIRQKLYGARDAGATYFLAPYKNCNEVTGHVPSGLTVFAVRTLKDSLAALKAIETGSDTSKLLRCDAS